MRLTLIVSGAALWVGVMCFAADDQVVPKGTKPASSQPAAKAGTKPLDKTPASPAVPEKRSSDEVAIRQTDDSYVKAFGEGNARGVAAHFTIDAEYVDEVGSVSQGREAIEKSLVEYFAANPGSKLEMNIDSIRFISPGVAVEDGRTTITHEKLPAPIECRYTTVHVKTGGKWLAASVRDHAPHDRRQHRAQLQQLEWMVGDWVDEGDDSIVTFSCHAVDNGNFLLRKFTIQVAGQEVMSGTQRIGWDPVTSKLRAWIFDSDGGYAEGTWHRNGDNWVLKSAGVTADGETASGTSIYTFVNDHTMTWQSVDHEIAGEQLPDSDVVRIVRQAPAPGTTVEHKAAK